MALPVRRERARQKNKLAPGENGSRQRLAKKQPKHPLIFRCQKQRRLQVLPQPHVQPTAQHSGGAGTEKQYINYESIVSPTQMSHGVKGTCINHRWSGNSRREGLPCGGTQEGQGRDTTPPSPSTPEGSRSVSAGRRGLWNGFLRLWILPQKMKNSPQHTRVHLKSFIVSLTGIYQTQIPFERDFLSVWGHTVGTSVTSVWHTDGHFSVAGCSSFVWLTWLI